MSACSQIAQFACTAATTKALPQAQAQAWLDHLAGCHLCAELLATTPEAALMLIEQSHGTSDDPQFALAPRHDEMLALGRVLASRLDRVVRAQLASPHEIQSLRHELRHAPDLANATADEIRCAVALTEFSHALEGLVFQDEEKNLPRITLTLGGSIGVGSKERIVVRVGYDEVPYDYFVERIAEAISCRQPAAADLLHALFLLLQERILTIPAFTSTAGGDRVNLVHIDSDDAAFSNRPDGFKMLDSPLPEAYAGMRDIRDRQRSR